MANTIKDATLLVNSNRVIVYSTIICVGNAQETNKVIYDSSAVATTLGIVDPLDSTLISLRYATSSAAGIITINWDATTPVPAWTLPHSNDGEHKFCKFGGLRNQGGTGITGDITLTTTGFATGETIALILEVKPN